MSEESKADPAPAVVAPAASSPPELVAYRIYPYPSMPIVPATSQRSWMDQTDVRFAYRCLPLLIANQNGWFIINVHKIRVVWTGGNSPSTLKIICKGGPRDTPCPAVSHFGHGVLTWNLNYLFRTPSGYNLWARGPTNMPKDGIVALDGIVETDWSVATFTMNWKLTAVNQPVDFEPGEPICLITPVRRGEVESFVPRVCDLSTEPALHKAFEAWSSSRTQFNRELDNPDSAAAEERWQKQYFQGFGPNGIEAPEHQTKLTVRDFQLPIPPPKS